MIALALAFLLTTTNAPTIAYLKYQAPPIYSGPNEPMGVPGSFILAFTCLDWISCAKDYILVIDGVRQTIAVGQMQEVGQTPLQHTYETPLTLIPGLHTIGLIGRDGTVESPMSVPLPLQVILMGTPLTPSNIVIRKS